MGGRRFWDFRIPRLEIHRALSNTKAEVYLVIVALMIWFENLSQLPINGLLTVTADWGDLSLRGGGGGGHAWLGAAARGSRAAGEMIAEFLQKSNSFSNYSLDLSYPTVL